MNEGHWTMPSGLKQSCFSACLPSKFKLSLVKHLPDQIYIQASGSILGQLAILIIDVLTLTIYTPNYV